MLPARRHKNSGRQNVGKRFPAHLAFVRGFECAIAGRCGHHCSGKIEAAHIDYEGSKGMGMKVPDVFTLPLCSGAHIEQGQSWRQFEARYGIDALAMAKELARKSPSIVRAAMAAGYDAGHGENEA